MALSLNIGCGNRPLPEHVNIDCNPGPGVDVVAQMWDLPYEAGTVDAIVCVHAIEHVFPYQWPGVLAEWRRVLRSSGQVLVSCPDFAAVARAFTYGTIDIVWARTYLMGTVPPYNSVDYDDPASYHRTLHSARSLAEDFQSFGFEVTSIKHEEWWNLFVLAVRP